MPPCRHAAMPRRFCLGLRYSCFAGGADLEVSFAQARHRRGGDHRYQYGPRRGFLELDMRLTSVRHHKTPRNREVSDMKRDRLLMGILSAVSSILCFCAFDNMNACHFLGEDYCVMATATWQISEVVQYFVIAEAKESRSQKS